MSRVALEAPWACAYIAELSPVCVWGGGVIYCIGVGVQAAYTCTYMVFVVAVKRKPALISDT